MTRVLVVSVSHSGRAAQVFLLAPGDDRQHVGWVFVETGSNPAYRVRRAKPETVSGGKTGEKGDFQKNREAIEDKRKSP
jgi:hypothetical protein